MQIQLNEKNEVIGYAVTGVFLEGKEIAEEELPEGFIEGFRPGKYLYGANAVRENPGYEEREDITPVLEEIAELKEELRRTDYKALKYIEGWLSEAEYSPIKAQRQELREKINELEERV